MALSCNNQLDLYGGGPRQQRSRGFVTVREPALGFFATGSTVEQLNGIYVCVRNDSVTTVDKSHKVLLSYRNDNKTGWLLVLVEPKEKPKPKEPPIASYLRRRQKQFMDDSDEEDSDDEVSALHKREWLFVDPQGRDRFRHDGDTIIPGAGVSWKHLHRQPSTPVEESCDEEEAWASADSDSDDDEMNGGAAASSSSKKPKTSSKESNKKPVSDCRAIQPAEEKKDDEDELPWQVIAILDRETVSDMRYTQRCYDANIVAAKSGKRLPKIEALTGLDPERMSGCWVYRVRCLGGVEVRVSPMFEAPVIGHKRHGEYLQIMEKRTVDDEVWLQIKTEQRNDSYYRGMYLGGDNWLEERWVSLRDEDFDEERDRLEEIVDLPEMRAELPAEKPDAGAFDRPFEPRLADASDASMDEEEAEEEKKAAAGKEAGAPAESTNKKNEEPEHDIESWLDLSHFRMVKKVRTEKFSIGEEVILSGLKNAAMNGKIAVIVTEPESGRQGVKFKDEQEQAVSVRIENMNPASGSDSSGSAEGPLAKCARSLGLSLEKLGMVEEDDVSSTVASEKDTSPFTDKKSTDAEPVDDPMAVESSTSPELVSDNVTAPVSSTVASNKPSRTVALADVFAVALRAQKRDSFGNRDELLAAQSAHDVLVKSLKSRVQPTRVVAPRPTPSDRGEATAGASSSPSSENKKVEVEQKSEDTEPAEQKDKTEQNAVGTGMPAFIVSGPSDVLRRGTLGVRAQDAAVLCESDGSIKAVVKGVHELRTLITQGTDDSCSLDNLRLRLTLIPALLRTRREVEAAREAAVAIKLYPDSTAAALWHARFSLRSATETADKEKALSLLKTVAEDVPSLLESSSVTTGVEKEASSVASTTSTAHPEKKLNPHGVWAREEAKRRVNFWKEKERGERRAMDAYSRGLFEDAIKWYDMAIQGATKFEDDKWARAELFAARAGSYRRMREFGKALDDLDHALGLFPKYKRALFRKGVVQMDAGRAKDAIQSFETLMGLGRDWEHLLDWLVRAHAMQRRGGGVTFQTTGMFSEQKLGTWAEAAGEGDIANEKDHYAVLGVSQDATEKQLKRAYRVLSLKYHPDKEGGSTRAFQRVALAYQTLSDPEKREQYNNGADLGKEKKDDDSDSDDEQKKQSLREEIERKYFPERYKFWPFGDPFVQKRKREEQKQRRQGRPAWFDQF
ncbi:unnamed protein product [Amoebophrya sp. A120]|nr:unnamed protein product [Amoebophrya sp. A120]|eukprot:GSA120T00018983001.1